MTKQKQPARDRGAIKDPEDWVTGDEPMTGAQASYYPGKKENHGLHG
jgi:hypothetical protein